MAKSAVSVSVTGIREVMARIKANRGKITTILGAALFQEGEKIMSKSLPLVPVVTGNLRVSGHVDLPQQALGTMFVELGYGGAASSYALAVHENPRAGKTGGVSPQGVPYRRNKQGKPTWSHHPKGQWKYLEQPFRAAAVGMRERIQAFVHTKVRMAR